MQKIKIAATGLSGLVGSRIHELLQDAFEFIPLSHTDFDITHENSVETVLNRLDFDIFLHMAAYTQVDLAETERQKAHILNVASTKYLFNTVHKKKKQFIYISTGFVFDGIKPPFTEESNPHPLGYYGETKYEGEQIVKDKGMILRFDYPYRAAFEKKKDFVRTLLNLLQQGKTLKMVNDSLITPIFIDDIAYSLSYLFTHFSPEIYHVVGANSLSPYDSGKQICEVFNLNPQLIKSISYGEYFTGKALRPQFAELKTIKKLPIVMHTFKEGLQIIKGQMGKRL